MLQLLIVIAVDKNTLAAIIGQLLDQEGTLVVKELIVSQTRIWLSPKDSKIQTWPTFLNMRSIIM